MKPKDIQESLDNLGFLLFLIGGVPLSVGFILSYIYSIMFLTDRMAPPDGTTFLYGILVCSWSRGPQIRPSDGFALITIGIALIGIVMIVLGSIVKLLYPENSGSIGAAQLISRNEEEKDTFHDFAQGTYVERTLTFHEITQGTYVERTLDGKCSYCNATIPVDFEPYDIENDIYECPSCKQLLPKSEIKISRISKFLALF